MKRGLSLSLALMLLLTSFAWHSPGCAEGYENALLPISETPISGDAITLRFTLAAESLVSLTLWDMGGAELYSLLEGDTFGAGEHVQLWDGYLPGGEKLPAGSYRFVLTVGAAAYEQPLTVLAAQPQPSFSLTPYDDLLYPGHELMVDYETDTPGTLKVTLHAGGSASSTATLSETDIEPGSATYTWDGLVEDAFLESGIWTLAFTLVAGQGQQVSYRVMFECTQEAPEGTGDSAQAGGEVLNLDQMVIIPEQPRQVSRHEDPHDNCYWQMNPDQYDLTNPEDQQKIWEIMMQPITVLDIHPTEHVYPVLEAGMSTKPSTNITGQLHGTTQGVHVLETLDNGWSLIEAFSNDGYGSPSNFIRGFSAQLIEGYVKTELLKTVTPYEHIGLLIDKLNQKLYVFQDGVITGELLISTGKPTKDSPYYETPAGEFLTDTWVGKFPSGNMQCDLAIRINGGVLLHEVPHKETADGTRQYAVFEQHLGTKASHGCVRVQRAKNEQGMNMAWLWNNLKRYTKVLIWDDVGRVLPIPAPDTPMYYNTTGGQYFHSEAQCSSVNKRWFPLKEITYADLDLEEYLYLTPCPVCKPTDRLSALTTASTEELGLPSGDFGEEEAEGASELLQEVEHNIVDE